MWHTKKKNRLDVERLHDLIFEQFKKKNTQKRNRKKNRHDKDVLIAPDDIEQCFEGCTH